LREKGDNEDPGVGVQKEWAGRVSLTINLPKETQKPKCKNKFGELANGMSGLPKNTKRKSPLHPKEKPIRGTILTLGGSWKR